MREIDESVWYDTCPICGTARSIRPASSNCVADDTRRRDFHCGFSIWRFEEAQPWYSQGNCSNAVRLVFEYRARIASLEKQVEELKKLNEDLEREAITIACMMYGAELAELRRRLAEYQKEAK